MSPSETGTSRAITTAREVPTRRSISHELKGMLALGSPRPWRICVDKKEISQNGCLRARAGREHTPCAPVPTLGTLGIRKYPHPTRLEKP
jgi:hypothetical protein